jgi:hypothetical protein
VYASFAQQYYTFKLSTGIYNVLPTLSHSANVVVMQPYGFDVGASDYGIVLKGLDYGVAGMRVGGQVSSSP